MSRLRHFFILTWLTSAFIGGIAKAQQPAQEDIDPAEARLAWLSGTPGISIAAVPYTLTSQERNKLKGTFGIDLSHYSFDIAPHNNKCQTQAGYGDAACSCRVDWDAVVQNGIRYVYSKASEASFPDLSFHRSWTELEARHTSNTLFRGAYHFLRPGTDPEKQAKVFLESIGAVNGNQPKQLPPALDIEWATRKVELGSAEFQACPHNFLKYDKDYSRWICDMWYTVPPDEIANMAQKWIDRVVEATGLPVLIYTNPIWWNSVMKDAGVPLTTKLGIWTSRFSSKGPAYDKRWTAEGGSVEWGMPPLPRGASYPTKVYNVGHFWQYSETGRLPASVISCSGSATQRAMDMDWIPVTTPDFEHLFKVSN